MENKKQFRPNDTKWINVFLLVLIGMIVYWGYKEHLLTAQIEIQVEQEQDLYKKRQAAADAESQRTDRRTPSGVIPTTTPQNPPTDDEQPIVTDGTIRVLLMNTDQDSPVHASVVLQSDSGLRISSEVSTEAGQEASTAVEAGVSFDAGQLLQPGDTAVVQPVVSNGTIRVISMERSQGSPSYEGRLRLHRTEEGFWIVNDVDLETYLKYVVPSEMPSSYPAEALKAQAVCARTYAVRQIAEKKLETYGADVDDTVSFQVYNNISRTPSTDQAVEDTRGQIICWGQEPIQAYFFSTSCGFTSSDEVWMSEDSPAYLRSIALSETAVETAVPDISADGAERSWSEEEIRRFLLEGDPLDYEREDPWYRWDVTIPWEEVCQHSAEQFPQIGLLQTVTAAERSSGGAVTRLLLQGESGSMELENEYRIREFLSPGANPVILQDGSSNSSMKLLPSAYITMELSDTEEGSPVLRIRGGGYGHGVGMSQNGAKHMAQNGMSWTAILSVFYPDTDIQPLI